MRFSANIEENSPEIRQFYALTLQFPVFNFLQNVNFEKI